MKKTSTVLYLLLIVCSSAMGADIVPKGEELEKILNSTAEQLRNHINYWANQSYISDSSKYGYSKDRIFMNRFGYTATRDLSENDMRLNGTNPNFWYGRKVEYRDGDPIKGNRLRDQLDNEDPCQALKIHDEFWEYIGDPKQKDDARRAYLVEKCKAKGGN